MAERRDPNWVDYGNLAANLVQVGQMATVNSRLNEIRQIEAAREERASLINQLRQMVFDTEDDLARLQQFITRAPRGVYAVIQILTKIYDESNIVPQTFQEFVDKDRVKKIRQSMVVLRDGAVRELSEGQRSDIDHWLNLSYHLNELEALIKTQKAREELQQTQQQWDEMEKEHKRKVKPWSNWAIYSALGFMVGLMLVCVVPVLVSGIFVNLGMSSDFTAVIYGISQVLSFLLLFVAPIVVFIYSMSRRAGAIPKGYHQMRSRRDALIRQMLPNERFTAFSQTYGGAKTSAEYIKIKEEVNHYIQNLIFFDRNNLPLPEGALQVSIG